MKIHGEYWPVRADVFNLDSLSAHGDYKEILEWLAQGNLKPERVFITHGEIVASNEMRKRIHEMFGWSTQVPELLEEVVI